MWPMRTEMTRDECRKCLRCLELEAYGSMVSVLRAQGSFTSEKQKLLQELAKVLHISNERHRAEIRRAVNDETLATIAEQLNGPNTGIDWTIEGRRTIPLLPRLTARSVFTTLANSLSLATAVANEKKFDRSVTSGLPKKSTAAETESHFEVKANEDLSVDTKLCSSENESDANKTLPENFNSIEHRKLDNNDIVEKPEITKIPEKRRAPSPKEPSNKVRVVSPSLLETLNHNIVDKITFENNMSASQASTHHQNITLIPLSVGEISDSKESTVLTSNTSRVLVPAIKQASTTIPTTSNAVKPKTIVGTVQNKISTKVAPATSSDASNISPIKVQTESKDAQPQDNIDNTQKTQKSENTSSNMSCIKRVAPIIHTNTKPVVSKSIISSNTHRVMAVHPGTTVSSGPGPPQIKQASPILAYKKWPSEQTATFNPQSTAKMSVTINSKKAVNIPHHSNTKLTTKTNVIVIQKGHAKGVTLSHAGKEVLGKVIMGGKNLCVTSQHNASSVGVLPHHISLNGDQTTTTLPTANPSNDSIKTNIKSGNTIVFNLRKDVLEKNKVLSQRFDSSGVFNSELKSVIQSRYTRLLTGDCNNDTNTIDREQSAKADSMITSTTDEKQHRKNNDVSTSLNSQVISPLDSSKVLGIKEILVRPKQLAVMEDDGSNIRIQNTEDEDASTFDTTSDLMDVNLENLEYSETVNTNYVEEHDDS